MQDTEELRARVANTETLLGRMHGEHNAPIGGWYSTAVNAVAKREGMNPYALDRLIRQ